MKHLFISLILILSTFTVKADVMVLIHGYLANANSWEETGINEILHQNGWPRAGMFRLSTDGPILFAAPENPANKTSKHQVYVATLPFDAPIAVQANTLQATLEQIRLRHPKQNIVLVGHSAGGLVSRMLLVQQQPKDVFALITIASPHLGTGKADTALQITENHGPLNMFKSFVGGSGYNALKHSRSLLIDLRHPQPGNLLYWLNIQHHPEISYTSIIRTTNKGVGDYYVPGFSQDMNNVPALQGKSATFTTPTSHYLNAHDAYTIIDIVNRIKDQKPSS